MSQSAPSAWRAVTRFGMGPSPADIEAASADPRAWLRDQLEPSSAPRPVRDLPETGDLLVELHKARDRGDQDFQRATRQRYEREASAWAQAGLSSPAPLRERLADFWSGWFTVSRRRQAAAGLVGAHAREAIRPHVVGRFSDMLLASCRHPAMLLYLDNQRSTGPGSPVGQRSGRGLNENLAREVLELHTVGAEAHTQDDVRALAEILTGWTIDRGQDRASRIDSRTRFAYTARSHQPGPKALLGQRFEGGEREGIEALSMLAVRPETARRVAEGLCRHFISDAPPPTATATLEATFLSTGGDLRAVTEALIDLDAPWDLSNRKLRSPRDLVFAAARGVGIAASEATAEATLSSLKLLEHAPWTASSPKGWPDTAEGWLGPEALIRRVEWAAAFAARVRRQDPRPMVDALLGPTADPAIRQAVTRAESQRDGLALLLASPQFQWR